MINLYLQVCKQSGNRNWTDINSSDDLASLLLKYFVIMFYNDKLESTKKKRMNKLTSIVGCHVISETFMWGMLMNEIF